MLMNEYTDRVFDAICRKAFRQPFVNCETEHVGQRVMAAAVLPMLGEMGPAEGSKPASLSDDDREMIARVLIAVAEAGSWHGLKVLPRQLRDLVRANAKELAAPVIASPETFRASGLRRQLETDIAFGPIPSGLRSRELGIAGVALRTLADPFL